MNSTDPRTQLGRSTSESDEHVTSIWTKELPGP